MNCSCKDWQENIDFLNAGFVMCLVHGSSGYEGKVFKFCPWCGAELSGKE